MSIAGWSLVLASWLVGGCASGSRSAPGPSTKAVAAGSVSVARTAYASGPFTLVLQRVSDDDVKVSLAASRSVTLRPGLIHVDVIGDASAGPIAAFADTNYLTIGLRDRNGRAIDCRCSHTDSIVSSPIALGVKPVELLTFSVPHCFGKVADVQLCVVNRDPSPGPSDLPNFELCVSVPFSFL